MIFFFKQKTAYEMLRSLVGSEMCIRDRGNVLTCTIDCLMSSIGSFATGASTGGRIFTVKPSCLLYTSDAADDLLCVDLGGRRIIKKKNTSHITTITPF